MYVYVEKDFFHRSDPIIIKKIWNCHVEFLFFEENVIVKENSLFILFKPYIGQGLNEPVNSKLANSLKNIENKSIIFIHHHKSLSNFINHEMTQFKEFIDMFSFKEQNVFFITQLNYDITYIKKCVPLANILAYDKWLHEIFDYEIMKFPKNETTCNVEVNKKFSIFCNRYSSFRLSVYCELIVNQLLENFHYTFNNYYNSPLLEMIQAIPEKYTSENKEIIKNWLTNSPNKIEMTSPHDYKHFFPDQLKYYFEKSKIHIVIETDQTDSGFLTEKTYKAIYYKKPFILISQKNALEALKAEGYKTFSPFIDETYDTFENIDDRLDAIIKEIKRLNSLSEDKLNNILVNLEDIINHNLNNLYEIRSKPISEEFKFKQLLNFKR